jgi:hypothetical protein
MDTRSGRFRVYRVVDSVAHLNLQAVDAPQLYTVYQSGYGEELQAAVDDLRTGDRIDAELAGDPDDADEPWRLRHFELVDSVEMDFAVDVEPPDIARDLWESGQAEPACAVLTEDGEQVGVCCVQPRAPLSDGLFVPNVLTGLLPIEPHLTSLLEIGEPAAEALFLDPDTPDATQFSEPYGVVLLFSDRASTLADRFRETYDIPRGTDTRPAFDPYGL